MKIVIEIDDARFKDIRRIACVQLENCHFKTVEQIIANGTPLPKGHGDLIDRAKIYKAIPAEEDNCTGVGMTREEAIKWLNYHINITDYEETDELYIALKMAIEALEQEPCEDCISREELDKALRNFIRNFPSINPQEPKLDTLDEIRAEIMDWETDIYENEYDAEIHDFVFERIYEIIDEHKTESEE